MLCLLPGSFLVIASVGFIAPNATALALEEHRATAGSASALLGVLQYVIGAAVAPLVGISGTGTALPMTVIMALLSSAACVTFALLTSCARRDEQLQSLAHDQQA
ncbi:MAG: hypothetical protein M3014_14900 [Chloroflexota bacterium]|nr:hypothetical protein [Chloroflexota bacterium]